MKSLLRHSWRPRHFPPPAPLSGAPYGGVGRRLSPAADPLDPLRLFSALRPLGFTALLYTPCNSGDLAEKNDPGWSYILRLGGEIHGERGTTAARIYSDDEISSRPFLRAPCRPVELMILSYDYGRKFEALPDKNPNLFEWPELIRFSVESVVACSSACDAIWIDCDPDEEAAILGAAMPASASLSARADFRIGAWTELMSEQAYEKIVIRAKEYIASGDIYQVNLARWFEAEFSGDAFGIFAALAEKNPSPYSAYIELPELRGIAPATIVSSSPELLFQLAGGRIMTRPIAGTYPRDELPEHLPRDPKERAEHIMLIDLERNDLGRIARPGSVKVEQLLAVESYSHLHHIVSQIAADLNPDVALDEILRAVFPGGTITGCPKIRAMEIIDELEPYRRGIYTGSIGFIGDDGEAVFNIAIRTAIAREGRIFLAAGAGIVADSKPDREARETRLKAAAFLELSGSGR